MKLDTKAFRYLSTEDWRILTGVELGSKNHEVVPTPLIIQLSGLRAGHSGAQRSISTLAKAGLIAREKNIKYDGYRLTYGGLDYLALHSHTKSDAILHLGSQMGVGKESDIYLVTTPVTSLGSTDVSSVSSYIASRQSQPHETFSEQSRPPTQAILKIHRLGRISFRTVRTNRAYHGHRSHPSWLYLSRLSAHKEYLCMTALHRAGFAVPTPINWNRHTIVMSLVPGIPLRQVPLSAFELAAGGKRAGREARDQEIARLYGECMEMALLLAEVGVIHGDLNEFNILIENVPDPEEYEYNEDDDIINTTTNTPIPTSEQPSAELTKVTHSPSPTSLGTSTPTMPLTSKPDPIHKPLHMKPHVIDFPQVTSLSHPQAPSYFNRDTSCIRRFFLKRYGFEAADQNWPSWADAEARLRASKRARIDVEIEAAGFSRKMAKELEEYLENEGSGEDGEEQEGASDDEVGSAGIDGLADVQANPNDALSNIATPRDDYEGALVDTKEATTAKVDAIANGSNSASTLKDYLPDYGDGHADEPATSPAGETLLSAQMRRMSVTSSAPSHRHQHQHLQQQQQPRTVAKAKAGWAI